MVYYVNMKRIPYKVRLWLSIGLFIWSIVEITHEEAEAFIRKEIDEEGARRLLKHIKHMNRIYD